MRLSVPLARGAPGHSADSIEPDELRVNGAVRNHPAFGVKPGDPMYLAPEAQVSIW